MGTQVSHGDKGVRWGHKHKCQNSQGDTGLIGTQVPDRDAGLSWGCRSFTPTLSRYTDALTPLPAQTGKTADFAQQPG